MTDARVHTLVCGSGADAFRVAGLEGEWPCDSRWVSPTLAASMLGIPAIRLRRHMRGKGVPMNFQGWVSLPWVEGILRARTRR